MTYWFSKEADESLSEFSKQTTAEIIKGIDEAAEEEFYNSDHYSYIYDDHGTPWDKIDLKNDLLNHRVFFIEAEGQIYILEMFDRDELDYENRELYNLLRRINERILDF